METALLFIMILIIILIILVIVVVNQNKIPESVCAPEQCLNTETNSKDKLNPKRMAPFTAIIIEPRKHKALEFVLNNFLRNLDQKWDFIIFHGVDNEDYLNEIVKRMPQEYQDRISMKNLNIKNLSIDEYSQLLVSEDFNESIPTEMFLIFQTDSMICDNTDNYIEQFMKYDYVGAPWSDGVIGNGGLSLRRKSKMLEIIRSCNYINDAEDLFFCRKCPDTQMLTPDMEEARLFSVETVMSDHTFGIHKPWLYLPSEMDKLQSICPGLNKLVALQSTD
ncbi:Hypothetical protein HVR_LOCUS912 [uncultured virus]|nr:Hypothetical protein HVR_LOCUS912 [uncultured virus]